MNKKLKIVLQTEFACDSVFWIYDEFGENINGGTWVEQEEKTSWDSKLPDELLSCPDIKRLSMEIMKEYNSLFINNEKEFSYKGFAGHESEVKYMQKINELRKILYEKCSDKYEIVDDLR